MAKHKRSSACRRRQGPSAQRRQTSFSPIERRLRFEPLEERRLLSITVNTLIDVNNAGDGLTTLREAIVSAPAGETINFSVNGTIHLTQSNGQLLINKNLVIDGPGADLLTIDAGHGTDGDPDTGDGIRVFRIDNSSLLLNVSISGVTITGGDTSGGSANAGGGILNLENLTLSGVVITDNASMFQGGGVAHAQGSLTVINSTISSSGAPRGGGLAIGAGSPVVSVSSSTIADNSATEGGGVYKSTGSLSVLGSTIRDNTATGFQGEGGGIHALGDVTVADSTVSGNRTTGNSANGGGIFSTGNVTLDRSTVVANSTTGDAAQGGGILVQGNLTITDSTISGNLTDGTNSHIAAAGAFGDLTITSSTISGNRTLGAQSVAGGTANDGTLTVRYSTVTDNHANDTGIGTPGGGGLRKIAGQVVIQHSIVAGNTTTSGTSPDFRPGTATLDVDYSLIGNTAGSGISAGTGTGNVLNQNPLLAPLAYNGGPTQTHALGTGSPAYNAGSASAATGVGTVPQFDQRGTPFGRVASGRIDIGALEAHPLAFVVDTVVDESDGSYSAGDFSLREAIGITNSTAGFHTIEFSPTVFATAQTILLQIGQLQITNNVTIAGPGRDLLTISADDPTPGVFNGDGTRIFRIMSASAIDVTLSGLTLTGGDVSGSGGAIESFEKLTIQDAEVRGNSAVEDGTLTPHLAATHFAGGGGIWSDADLTLIDTVVSENSADVSIHAIDDAASTTFVDYRAGGGGILQVNDVLRLTRSTISDNIAHVEFQNGASNGAGGAGSSTPGNPGVSGDFRLGGGGLLGGGLMIVTDTTLSRNHADVTVTDTFGSNPNRDYVAGGGGVLVGTTDILGILDIRNSTISGNQALVAEITGLGAVDVKGGGGVASYLSGLSLSNCTIAENSSDTTGGGIRIHDGALTIHNSIIADNAGGSPDLAASALTIFDVDYSLIGNTLGLGFTPGTGVGNLLNVDPTLGPLADNGGPTLTHALLAGSPAINVGDPAYSPNDINRPPVVFDQRGPGFDRVKLGRIDMGAYEVQQVIQPPEVLGDYNLNGIVDAADYTKWRDTLGHSVANAYDGADGDGDGAVDDDDYDVWKAHFGQTNGAVPDVNVQGGGLNIADGDTTPTAGDGTYFGEIAVPGGVPATHSFVIQNTGTATLTLDGMAPVSVLGADFTVTSQPSLLTLAPGQSTSFAVQFAPTASGLRQATVQIGSSDSDENPYDFTVSGIGGEVNSGVGQVFIVATDIENPSQPDSHIYRFDRDGTADGQFFGNAILTSVATNGTDLFVADAATERIKRFSPAGSFLGDFVVVDTSGTGGDYPYRIEFDNSGSLYVTADRLVAFRYDSAGAEVADFSHPLLDVLEGIDADANGNVWIASVWEDVNEDLHRLLLKFSSDGNFLASYNIDAYVENTSDLAIDEATGMLYMADEFGGPFGVKSFDISSGAPIFVASISTPGIENVAGLSFDPESGNLLVADFNVDSVGANSAEITTSGNIVNTFVLGSHVLAFDIVALPGGAGSADAGQNLPDKSNGLAPVLLGPSAVAQSRVIASHKSGIEHVQTSREPRIQRRDPETWGPAIAEVRDKAIATWLAWQERESGREGHEKLFRPEEVSDSDAGFFHETLAEAFESMLRSSA